jgi:hypothetical protein
MFSIGRRFPAINGSGGQMNEHSDSAKAAAGEYAKFLIGGGWRSGSRHF